MKPKNKNYWEKPTKDFKSDQSEQFKGIVSRFNIQPIIFSDTVLTEERVNDYVKSVNEELKK